MKTIEEKARAYDEAIRKLRGMMPNWERLSYNGKTFLQDLIYIIPELAESEDEKIRKWCISHFKECINVIKDNDEYKEYLSNKVLAWLERQGEHANFRNKIQIHIHNVDLIQRKVFERRITDLLEISEEIPQVQKVFVHSPLGVALDRFVIG